MRRLASDSIVYGLGSVANQALAVLLLPLYTRCLAPDEYGAYAFLAAAGTLFSLMATFGVASGLTRIFYLYEDEAERGRVVFTAFAFAAVSATLLAGSMLFAAPALARLLFDSTDHVGWVRLAIVIYSLASLNGVPLGTLQIHRRPRIYVACSVLGLLASCAMSIWLVAVRGAGVTGVLEGALTGVVVQLGLGSAACLRGLRVGIHGPALREMLLFSLPLLPTNLAGWGLGLADRWFLKHYASFTDVGLYSLGFRFGSVLDTLFVGPFTLAWFPYLYSILGQPDHRDVVARVLEYFALVAGMLVLGLGLFGGEAIRLIATPAYQDAERVIFWIGLGVLFRGMTFVTMSGMNITRRNPLSAAIYAGGVAVDIGLLALLVPRYGMMGAAAATVWTYFWINIGFWRVSERFYPIPFRPGKILWLVCVLVAIYGAAQMLEPPSRLAAIAFKGLLFASMPIVLLASGFVAPDDLARARQLVRRLRAA